MAGIQTWVRKLGSHIEWIDGNLNDLTIYEHAEGQYFFDKKTKKGRWHKLDEAPRKRQQRPPPTVTMAQVVMRVMRDVH
jgi:hypothetical protein